MEEKDKMLADETAKKTDRQFSTASKKVNEKQLLLNRWRSFSIVLIVLDLLLLVIALTVTVVWMKDTNEGTPLPYPSEFCLPTESIKLQYDDDRINFKNCTLKFDEEGRELCCMSTPERLSQLVDLYVKRRYRVDQASSPMQHCPMQDSTASKNESAARVVGYNGSLENQYSTYIVLWKDKSDKSFINDRISYRNGAFTVAKKGFYYIYSQITFMEDNMQSSPDSTDRSMYTSLCHFLYRKRPNMPDGHHEKLLESSQSKCQLQTQRSNSTSYIGAVFYLDAEEQVMVKVTDPEKISGSEYSNYFGLHMI